MTPEEYKNLSIKEFTEAAKVYDSGHAKNRNRLRRCLFCSPAGKQKGRAPLREHVLLLLT